MTPVQELRMFGLAYIVCSVASDSDAAYVWGAAGVTAMLLSIWKAHRP